MLSTLVGLVSLGVELRSMGAAGRHSPGRRVGKAGEMEPKIRYLLDSGLYTSFCLLAYLQGFVYH